MPPTAVDTESHAWPLLLIALFAGAIMAGTVGLWAYYGTTVFFEIVRTGWVACF
jgi:hypothetical protein